MTAKIIPRKRTVGSYKYNECENCGHENAIEKPLRTDMPYCGYCGKIVLDAAQNYCCWCGSEFER